MDQDLSATQFENLIETPKLEKNFQIEIDGRRLKFSGSSLELAYLSSCNIGATFVDVMNSFLSDAPNIKESRISKLSPLEFIESPDEHFSYDLIAFGLNNNLSVIAYDARRIIDMLADGDFHTRSTMPKKLRSYDIVCICNLHLVANNVYRDALSKVIMESMSSQTRLVFHGKSFDVSYDKFKEFLIGESIKGIKPIKLKQTEAKSVLSFDGLIARQNLSLDSSTYCLPMIFSRIGLFSAIDSVERKKLTEVRLPDRWNPKKREIDIPIVRDFTFNGMYVQISGPVVDVDTDMKTFTFLLSEFLRTPNGQGVIRTSWKKVARGFDFEKDQEKIGGKQVQNKQRSVQRLSDISIKIFEAKKNVLLYKGSLIDRIELVGKGRYSYLNIKLSQDIAKELLRYNSIDIALLDLPQVDFVVYNYLRSHNVIYDMHLDTWLLVLGRNYRGYSIDMRMLKRSLEKAFKNLEGRGLIESGWSVTKDFVKNVKLCAAPIRG